MAVSGRSLAGRELPLTGDARGRWPDCDVQHSSGKEKLALSYSRNRGTKSYKDFKFVFRFSLLAGRPRRNDVLRIPGLEVIIGHDDAGVAVGRPVNPRPLSVRSQPGLPFANQS